MATNPFGRDPLTNSPFPVPDKKGHFTQESASPLPFGTPDARYGSTTGVVSRAVWSSPLYDLRYGLGQVDGFSQRRQKNIEPNILFGGGSHLNLFVKANAHFGGTGEPAIGFIGAFRWFYIEFGEPMNPAKEQFLHLRIDCTDSFTSGNYIDGGGGNFDVVSLIQWRPQGPLRYWGCALVIDKVLSDVFVTGVPTITIAAALH